MTKTTPPIPAHIVRHGSTRSNGRAPAQPVQKAGRADQFEYEGLKAERRRHYEARLSAAQAAPARVCNASSRDSYRGEELRLNAARPGCNDHLALPSRVGVRLHFRDGRVERVPA
ncbi:MAG: hypothetical protein ACRECD_13960 [Burkholderiaceae bacterium]